MDKEKKELMESGKLSEKTMEMLRSDVTEDDSALVNMLGLAKKKETH